MAKEFKFNVVLTNSVTSDNNNSYQQITGEVAIKAASFGAALKKLTKQIDKAYEEGDEVEVELEEPEQTPAVATPS